MRLYTTWMCGCVDVWMSTALSHLVPRSWRQSKPWRRWCNAHIPYRGSKLTRILKDSFERRTENYILATVSPEKENIADSINTLNYISDFQIIKKKPTVKLPRMATAHNLSRKNENKKTVIFPPWMFILPCSTYSNIVFTMSRWLQSAARGLKVNPGPAGW